MKLEVEDAAEIVDPTPDRVEAAIRGLPVDNFAILDASRQCGKCEEPEDCEECAVCFMQTVRRLDGEGFCLEYYDDSDSQLYRCKNERLTLDWVLSAFRSYGRGDLQFKRTLEWEPHERRDAGSHVRAGLILALLIAAAVILLLAFR
jgi:hypothetical protein